MRNMKKWTALLTAAAVTAATLAGCGGNMDAPAEGEDTGKEPAVNQEEQTEPETGEAVQTDDFSEHMDISLAFWDVEAYFSGTRDDKVLKTLEEKFNVTFVPQNVTWDDYGQKLQLWAASDSLPDIFAGGERSKASFAKWAKEGLLKEIPADLSNYENLAEYMNSPELPTCQVDGKTYCIFRQTYPEQAFTVKDRTLIYRWDLAQEAGITKEPENWDEFRKMTKAIIEADPEGKGIQGLTSTNYGWLTGIFFPYTMPLAATGGVTFYWEDNGDGTYVPSYLAGEEPGDKALPVWQLLRDMYTEGTIEKDIAVITSAQAVEKFLQGTNAALIIDGSTDNVYQKIGKYWSDIYGEEFLDDIKFLGLMENQNGEEAYPIWDYAWSESYISSHVDDAKLNRILAIYDYLLSEEGTLLSTCGIEGESYSVDAEGKISYEEFGGTPAEVFSSINVFSILVNWVSGKNGAENFPSVVPQEYIDIDNARVEAARAVTIPEYNYDCTTAFIGLESELSFTTEDDMLTIMTGTEDVEKMWNDIIERYKAAGLEQAIEKVNEAVK